MGIFLRNNYYDGKISSKDYELMCIKEPQDKQYGRDLIKPGEKYVCSVIMASNWENIYSISYKKDGHNCGIEVPKDCFEELPIKSKEEIDRLKNNWYNDPIWDLEFTEGFEEYRNELLQFKNECEKKWKQEELEKQQLMDKKADELGVRGLYRIIKEHEKLLRIHTEAINALVNGNSDKAYKLLKGYEE